MSETKDYACPGEPFEPFGNWATPKQNPGKLHFRATVAKSIILTRSPNTVQYWSAQWSLLGSPYTLPYSGDSLACRIEGRTT